MKQFHLSPSDFLILIVDDTEANIKLLSHVLRGEGFTPIVAFNGTDAIDLIKSREPDLVLLDIMMPDMTGYEVCVAINKIDRLKEIPIIFLSALSETRDKVEGFDVGGVDYITKPFQKDEILARIRTHLFLSKLQKEREIRIEELKQRELELSELNKKKDDLVRMVSHDIKNPLTGIVGLANLLKAHPDFPEDDKMEMLNVMEQSGKKLLDIVEKVLDNEANSKKINEANLSETDIRELGERVISVNGPKAILKKIKLELVYDSSIGTALLDPVKMEIALNNLVSNALKFTPGQGSVQLVIDSTPDTLEFKVKDSGIGIPDTMVNKLFNSNEIGKSFSKKGTDGELGTGLGLDVVQNYVSIHNGKIWVESKENIGTTFFINIPLKEK